MNKLALLASTALVLLAGCATTADAAPPKKQCPNGVIVPKNKPCPTPTPVPVPTPTPTPVPTPTPTPVPTPTPTPVPTPTPTPVPVPTPTPTPGPTPTPPTGPLPVIISNFPTDPLLINEPPPPAPSPGDPGAFRVICGPAHLGYDDPVVYFGQPGRSHLHQFYGNTGVNANSTYESLRTTGDSTCGNKLNRSGYWIPAMLNGLGQVVRPDYISLYYKRMPANDPRCNWATHPQGMGKACVGIPRGLRFIAGYDMLAMRDPQPGMFWFNCDGPGAVSGHLPNIPVAAAGCPLGARLGAVIVAPDCWDGVNLDSPNHRSHLAYSSYSPGYQRCPDSHPNVIPQLQSGIWYTVDNTKAGWHFSSDVMPGMPTQVGGTSFHWDYFEAWDDSIRNMWETFCINGLLNCAGGNLGAGKAMIQYPAFQWSVSPRLVPVPPRP